MRYSFYANRRYRFNISFKTPAMLQYNKTFSSFSVNDIQKAKDFYSKIIGLEVADKEEAIEMTAGDNRVVLYPKPDHVAATFTVLNFSVDDIEKAVDSPTAQGVQFEQYGGDIKTDAKGICRSDRGAIAWFKDPAGNILSVMEGME